MSYTTTGTGWGGSAGERSIGSQHSGSHSLSGQPGDGTFPHSRHLR